MSLRIGPRTTIALVVALLAIAIPVIAENDHQFEFVEYTPFPVDIHFDLYGMYIGLFYGIVSQCVWMSSVIRRDLGRWLTVIAISLVGAAFTASEIEHSTYIRESAHLTGMAIAQSILFFLMGIVPWRLGMASQPARPRQFTLVDISFLTIAVAVLLAVGLRYQTPIDPYEYWTVWIAIWIVLPAMAGIGSFASTGSRRWQQLISIGGTLVIAGCGTYGIVAMERMTRDPDRAILMNSFVSTYGSFMLTFAGFSLLFPVAGRLDEASFCRRRSQELHAESP